MLNQLITTDEATRQLMSDDNANWSYEGANAIAEFLDEMWDDCGAPEHGFNVIDVRCEYSELAAADLVASYGYLLEYRDLPSDPAWTAGCEEVMEELVEMIRDQTHCLIELNNGGFIVGEF
ncbi:MAG: hypothetical protein ACR2NF_00760 [Pirellulales bacterium]